MSFPQEDHAVGAGLGTPLAAGEQHGGVLADAVAQHLLSAGLDLNYLLMFFEHDSHGASRLRHAIDEVDAAIISLRHLVVAAGRRS